MKGLNEILQEINSGRVAPIYFLCGERFPVEQVVSAIRRAVLDEASAGFNLDLLLAGEAGAEGILAAARTVPMLGAKRLVQVREMNRLDAKALGGLLPYVKDPSPTTCLLLTGDSADLRVKFFAELKKHAVLCRFDPLKERQVPTWLGNEARRMKIKLLPGTAERIADAVGTDMLQLVSALERLNIYAGQGKPIAPGDVEDLLVQTRQHSIFELTNAVGRGRRRQALLLLRQMIQEREPGVKIVVMLARHLRQLWSAKNLAARGLPDRAIAEKIGVHPFFVKDIIQQERGIPEPVLHRMHRALFEADRCLKSSPLPDAVILEQLVMQLCPATGR